MARDMLIYLLASRESGIFVVRPDGVVGAVIDSVDGLERQVGISLSIVFMSICLQSASSQFDNVTVRFPSFVLRSS
jgi:hypothetical protein